MRSLIVGIAVVLVGLVAGPVFAGEVAVSDLVTNGAAHSGTEVTVIGELVGDYGNRRDGTTWAQLNGDSYAYAPVVDGGSLVGSNIGIGIRMPTALSAGLDAPGRYRTVGPLVRITGTWKFHDPDRQGESYLDVSALEVVTRGRSLHEAPQSGSYIVGLILLVLAGFVMRWYVTRRDAVT